MHDIEVFGLLIAVVAAAVLVAVVSNRFSERLGIPASVLFLIGAAVASDLMPHLGAVPVGVVQRVTTVALVMILFDGGMHIGRRRLRTAVGAVAWLGTAGTFLAAGVAAAAAHFLFGLGWTVSLLIGAAIAPTDPAVVFAVLGRREVTGRSGVILEGESGANDPVGIALMVALLAAAGHSGLDALRIGAVEFVLQMGIGTVVGLAGGAALALFITRVPLPSAALYPLRTVASAFVIYGAATAVHGSGFLAVFIAGVMLGDVRAPYKADIERLSASLASLAEIVAFTALGLSISLHTLPDGHAWQIGLGLAALLTFLIRPLSTALLLAGARLRPGERVFIMWSGLKGAVPILLGSFVVAAQVPDAARIYNVIFVVVAFSVIVQGTLVPYVARWCRVPMRTREPEPWSLGIRLQHEPDNVRRYVIAHAAPADGHSIAELDLPEDVWISLINRDGRLLPVHADTVLRAGDQILTLADSHAPDLAHVFTP